jgi:hypothetical protein
MRRIIVPIFALAILGYVVAGCDSFTGESGTVTLTGAVVDGEDNIVAGAFVRVLPMDVLAETDADGRYDFDVDVDSTMNLGITVTKNGYGSASISILAIAGRVIEVPTLKITQIIQTVEPSGRASNIIFLDQSAASIGVTESGSTEIASVVFQATDSTGKPVSLAKSVDISFSMGQAPGGGEFIFPTTVRTDNNGEALVNLSAGTRAGVVQIVAQATVDGKLIRSLPVALTIHGGHPDQTHFSLGPARFNFPGLLRFGLTDPISILVGDQYGNPARPGTAVYFTTNYGVIGGSTQTDNNGQGGVNLFSGNPLPPDGVAIVTATTADLNENAVTAQTPVLMTGAPVITITQTFSSNSPFVRSYDYTVTDILGNPLVEGTTITAVAGGQKIKSVGNTNVRLGDTVFLGLTAADIVKGPGITEFSFSVVEDTDSDSTEPPAITTVTISSNGGNGNLQITFGAAGAQTSTEDATIEQLGPNTFRVIGPDQLP